MSTPLNNTDSFDYPALREGAMEWLRVHASEKWTDLNAHDPGVTITDNALYAASELGYILNLDLQQLLGNEKRLPRPEDVFFHAPVTLPDYSQYGMQHPSVQSISFDRLDCPDAHFYLPEGGVNPPVFAGITKDEVRIRGLYKVIVELAGDASILFPDTNKDLNDPVIHHLNQPIVSGPDTYLFALDIYFPYWDELQEGWRKPLGVNSVIALVEPTDSEQLFFATLQLDLQTGTGPVTGTMGIYIIVTPGPGVSAPALIAEKMLLIKTLLEDTSPDSTLDIFLRKMQVVAVKMSGIRQHLLQSRNLCEDIGRLQLCRIQEVSISMDLRVLPGIHPEMVLATILYQLRQMIQPPVKGVHLSNISKTGKPPDEFMEGPRPDDRGLIFQHAGGQERPKSIIASDIIHMVMDIAGIAAVENLKMSSYINGMPVTLDEEDCLALIDPVSFRPRFSQAQSIIRLLSGGVSLSYDPLQVLALEQSIVEESAEDISSPEPFALSMAFPEFHYHSLQQEFPSVYGLRNGDLSSDATALRIAQARQLKAYLLVFDQILANGWEQVRHLHDFFSDDPLLPTTKPVQAATDVDEFLLLTTSDFNRQLAAWETDDDFFRRRNLFLNHLLGRFGHGELEFSALPFLGPPVSAVPIGDRSLSPNQLSMIRQKALFLQDFSSLSYNRFKAYAYGGQQNKSAEESVWDSENVSGLEKRLSVLLALSGHKRRSPAADQDTVYLIEHVLLRPADDESDPNLLLLADLSTSEGKISGPDRDPYSFRISILLPGYYSRFQTAQAKTKLEQTIALEMPAHISWDVFWATELLPMTQFSVVYKNWLVLKAMPVPDQSPDRQNHLDALRTAQAKMVKALNFLRSLKYPMDPVTSVFELRSPPFTFDSLPPL